jgi:hydrogenase-4 component B
LEGNILLLVLILLPVLGAAFLPLFGRGDRAGRRLAAATAAMETALMLVLLLSAGEPAFDAAGVGGLGLHFTLDGFRRVWTAAAVLLWDLSLLYAGPYFARHPGRTGRYRFFTLAIWGAVMGLFLAADFFTLFIFFELMSYASYAWVAHDETPAALSAGGLYLGVAVAGGLAALTGLLLLWQLTGTLNLQELRDAAAGISDRGTLYAAGGCLLFGFGAKAGMFPLHFWLPKAYPAAPVPAAVLLSGILSKTGVFGILGVTVCLFDGDVAWGTILTALGAATMLWGAVLALLSGDLLRTLACSSMSQIGFILVGAGTLGLLGEAHGAVAARGVLLHMANHSLCEMLLFMLAGVVLGSAGTTKLGAIRGQGRANPLLLIAFLTGAPGLAGIPPFGGYLSKTLLHEGILEAVGSGALEWLFLCCGGLTLAYLLKIFCCLFLDAPAAELRGEGSLSLMDFRSAASLGLATLLIPVFAVTAGGIADLGTDFLSQAEGEAVHYFTWENIRSALLSIGFGTLVFAAARGAGRRSREAAPARANGLPKWLDLMALADRSHFLRVLHVFFGGLLRRLALLPDRLANLAFIVLGGGVRCLAALPDRVARAVFELFFRPMEADPDSIGEAHPAIRAGLRLDHFHSAVRGVPKEISFTETLWQAVERYRDRRRLTNSPSFALLMACLGLAGMLLYLLLG